MNIHTHPLFGYTATGLDEDLRTVVSAEADAVRGSAAALAGAAVEQLRRWSATVGVSGPDRVAVFCGAELDRSHSLSSLWLADRTHRVRFAETDDEDRTALSAAMETWALLSAALGLLLGTEPHPSMVVDLDTATVVTVTSDLDFTTGDVGDVFHLPQDPAAEVTFEEDMAAAEDLRKRCDTYGVPWPPGR